MNVRWWWSGVCNIHIILQELRVAALVLCRMVRLLTYIYIIMLLKLIHVYQGGTIFLFLSWLACCIFSLANMHSITLIPAYIHTHITVEVRYLSQGRMVPECCSMVKDLFRDVLVDWLQKGLPSLHLTLWLLRDMSCTKVLFLSLSGSSRGHFNVYYKGLSTILERMGLICLIIIYRNKIAAWQWGKRYWLSMNEKVSS